jgi:hypothetical protein
MAHHHYIPLSILSSFASTQAWKVVQVSEELKARIALADSKIIVHGQKRHWPICVYEKDTQKLTRKPAGKVCSQPGLYGILNYNDKLTRALIRLNLQLDSFDINLQVNSFRDFMQIGEEPLDPDFIERIKIGKLDNEFGRLMPLLRDRQQLDEEQISVVLRFVAFTRFRTPTWRRVYFPEAYARVLAPFKRAIVQLNRDFKSLEEEWGLDFDILNNAIDDHFYHMMIVESSSNQFNVLRAFVEPRVLVLHTRESLPFVTCDNPARPYYPDRLRTMFTDPLPGFTEPGVQIVFPLDPKRCLLISSNTGYSLFSHVDVKEKDVRAVNTALAIMADKEILFPEPNASVFEYWLELNKLSPIRRP